jgi:hypothetical protein
VGHFWVKVGPSVAQKMIKNAVSMLKTQIGVKAKKLWDIWDMALKRDE